MTEHKPYPGILQGFLVFFIYIGYTILYGLLSHGHSSAEAKLFGKLLVYLATFLTVHYLRKSHNGVTSYSLKSVPLPVFISGVVAWVSLYALFLIIIYLYPELEQTGYLAESHKVESIYALLSIALVAPVFEELIFRGVILDGFLKRYKPGAAIFWSALIFGVMHMDPVQSSFVFFIGLLTGWLFWKTRSLFLCILLHVFNNLAASYKWSHDTEPEQTLRASLTPLQFSALYALAILLFAASVYYINRYYRKKVKNRLVKVAV